MGEEKPFLLWHSSSPEEARAGFSAAWVLHIGTDVQKPDFQFFTQIAKERHLRFWSLRASSSAPLGISVFPSRSRALIWCLNFLCGWLWCQHSLFSFTVLCVWASDESLTLPQHLLLLSFVTWNNCFIRPRIECRILSTDLSSLTVLDFFPSCGRLVQVHIHDNWTIFRNLMMLYFEALWLTPLLHSLLLLRFLMHVVPIQLVLLSLINLAFLVTPGTCLFGTAWNCPVS